MASYEEQLEAWAKEAGSDGCSHVPDFYRMCCLEHDHSYSLGTTLRGVPVTKAQADQRFRDCIQARSSLRFLSPMSWWRWASVSIVGRGVWSRPLGLLDVRTEAQAARDAILSEVLGDG